MPRTLALALAAAAVFTLSTSAQRTASGIQTPVPVVVVGLTHGHVQGFFHALASHPEVKLVGISDPDAALRSKYESQFHLDHALFFADEAAMLRQTHPAAILVYTAPSQHLAAIRVAAPMHIAAMVEKPLATTVPDALAIQKLSEENHVPVLTNYETTWYRSGAEAARILASGQIGEPRRLVFRDGHEGPKEIGVDPEFLSLLTDPAQNGAGALFDFGCYGADITTVLMHGALPQTVTAVTSTNKPAIYAHVDDESTVVLQYLGAISMLEGSWNWPFSIKDMQIFGSTGLVQTVSGGHQDGLLVRLPKTREAQPQTAPALSNTDDDSLHYLVHVLQTHSNPTGDATALDTNVKVVQILAAARESARTHRTVTLTNVR